MTSDKSERSQTLANETSPARRSAYFAAYSLALGALMASPIRQLIGFVSDWENTNASHVLLIPGISVALIFFDRANIFRRLRFDIIPGIAVMLVGAAIYLSAGQWGTGLDPGDRIAWTTAAIVTLWLGGFLLVFGRAAFRAGLFPLLFLFFCSPIPTPILNAAISVLQRGSAEAAYVLLRLSGTPIYREGFQFAMPGLSIVVAPECSGIRSGISLLILTMLAGHLMLKSVWRWAVLVLLAVPILFFKNALRISTLSLLAIHVDKRIMEGELHREGGIPFFAVGLLLLYPALRILARTERKPDTAADSRNSASSGQTAGGPQREVPK
jgi:exosortase